MIHDLTGERFGRLLVLEIAPKTCKRTFWVCACDCGEKKTVRSDALTSWKTVSCGCLKKEQDRYNLTRAHTHKMTGTRLYSTYRSMIDRCYNTKVQCYPRYGGKGTRVCEEWLSGFEAFRDWAVLSGYADHLTIDRIDNSGNYGPDNCRWATNKEQCNNRRNNIRITLNGETKTLTQWCETLKLNYGTVRSRIKRQSERPPAAALY